MTTASHTAALDLRRCGWCWRLLVVALLLAVALPSAAETHTLSGRVADPQGLPMSGAVVRLYGANRVLLSETKTGEDGQFAFHEVSAGRYELRVEAQGFAALQRVLAVPLDTAQPLELALRLNPVEYQVTVTGRHGEPEETFIEPASVRIRGREELAQRDASHLPRMLAEESGLLTQETTPGQGSPVLRGQGAQTVLYLVDGIRFNNSTYRSGNVQYLGWVPSSAVDSVEVFLGPAGTQYGSDALGGAINVMTTPPPAWTDGGVRWNAETSTFFSTADLGAGTALRASVAGPRVTFQLNGSYRRLQGVRTGGGYDSHNVLRRFLGLPLDQTRDVIGSRMPDTDYASSHWATKLSGRLSSQDFLTASWLQSEQYGVQRYDRLLGGEGNLLSTIAPQRLSFGYLRYQRLGTGALRNLEATFSLNRQTDGGVSQTRETSTLQNEVNRVTSLGYILTTSWRPVKRHSLTGGGEFFDEFIFGRRTDIPFGGAPTPNRPRFPNGTRYRSLGLYLTDDWDAIPEKLLIETGLRFSAFRFRSFSSKNVMVNGAPTVPDASETFTDTTFNAGASYALRPQVMLFGRVARGFRAPTVFDLGEQGLTGGGFEVSPGEAVRVGAEIGDAAGSSAVSTGTAWRGLQPEVLWSYEGGLRWRFNRVSGNITFFDSEAFNSIQRRALIVAAPVVGQSVGNEVITAQDAAGRIFVDLDARPVVSRANIGRVRIHGAEASLRVDWTGAWSSNLRGSLHRGRELDTGNFARRIAPDFLFLSLRWTERRGRVWLEGFAELSGPQTRLNPSELDDPRIGALRSEATVRNFFEFGARRMSLVQNDMLAMTGETVEQVLDRVLGPGRAPQLLSTRTPGFGTLNLRGAVSLDESNELSFGLYNLADKNFRRHGSGFDSAGFNATFTYRRTFR
ncbi:MAG TPA: TonB-dependent receptor [Candidatus Acidoferrales bacterium]